MSISISNLAFHLFLAIFVSMALLLQFADAMKGENSLQKSESSINPQHPSAGHHKIEEEEENEDISPEAFAYAKKILMEILLMPPILKNHKLKRHSNGVAYFDAFLEFMIGALYSFADKEANEGRHQIKDQNEEAWKAKKVSLEKLKIKLLKDKMTENALHCSFKKLEYLEDWIKNSELKGKK